MKTGTATLTEHGAALLGYPELVGAEVRWSGDGYDDGFVDHVFVGDRLIGGILDLNDDAPPLTDVRVEEE